MPKPSVFDDVPHYLAWIWANDDYLSQHIPHTETDETNKLHLYGVNHITDPDLFRRTARYAVINDLTTTNLVETSDISVARWPHRISIYTDSRPQARGMMHRLINVLKESGGFSTVFGSACRVRFNSFRQFESANHDAASMVFQPVVKS